MPKLHEAIKRGDQTAVLRLLERGWANINETDGFGNTPLHYAAAIGDEAIFDLLLGEDPLIIKKNEEGRTPLDLAAENGHPDIVSRLMALGGDE